MSASGSVDRIVTVMDTLLIAILAIGLLHRGTARSCGDPASNRCGKRDF